VLTRKRKHPGSAHRDAAKGADQIDLDDAIEIPCLKEPNLAGLTIARGRTNGICGTRTVDQDSFLAVRGTRAPESIGHALVARDIHVAEHPVNFGGDSFTLRLLHVEDGNLDALRG